MKRQGMLVLAAVGALSACQGLKDAMTAHVDVVAKAGSQELSVERLAQLMGKSPMIPVEGPQARDVAKNIANLWVDYQLLAEAAAKGDSLADPKVIDAAMWAVIAQARIQKFGQRIMASLPEGGDTSNAAGRYAKGEMLAARHILFTFGGQPGQPVAQNVKDSVRKKAESVRAQVTPANFADMAKQYSGDPGSAQNGGLYPAFPRGQMVPPFEQAVTAIQPGQIAPGLVETPYGYHIIYRPTYGEVSQQFTQAIGTHSRQAAESTYLKNLETSAKIEIKGDAPLWAKAIAQDVEGHLKDDKVLATSTAGEFRASRLAQWLASLPSGAQLRAQLGNPQVPDTLVKQFVTSVVRNEVLLKQADSAKVELDTALITNMRKSFVGAVTAAWGNLGIAPSALTDTGKAGGDRQHVAAAKIEDYLDRLTTQRAQFVEVAVPIERALRDKYDYKVNDAGLDRALERAVAVRASSDSARTAGQPATAVPLPGQAPVGGTAPPPVPQGAPQPAAPQPATQPQTKRP
jgi:hypothetical protein